MEPLDFLYRAFLLVLGCVTLGAAVWDLYWTTMGEGGGPITRRTSKAIRQLVLWLHRFWPKSRLISVGGVVLTLTTVMLWIVMHWIGWTCLFTVSQGTIVNSNTGEPASLWERLYFTGYTLSTLGVGDIQPRGGFLRVLVAAVSLNGLFQISFSIAYLVPLALAASFKRSVATYISSLGKTADDVILNMWNGEDWHMLTQFLQTLTPDLAQLEQQHLTYPVLHYFHSIQRAEAIGPSLATLDEALTIVEFGMEEGHGPDPGAFHSARRIISDFLQTLDAAFDDAGAEVPPAPTLKHLREAGVPVNGDDVFQERVRELDERRRLLNELMINDAWSWDITRSPTRDEETGDEKEALTEVEAV